ncbi:MAG: glycerol-3-phosphate dehydrogenase/oxidase [Chlamydiota bacterium]
MKRERMMRSIEEFPERWDVIIVGGGATGLGAAVDSASRGYKTLLLEQCDFAKGTSSRSTKLIHGGLRYLQQGNIALVTEALKERGLLFKNAPHLVHHLPFLVPNYKWWEAPFYGIGLKIYDILAGKLGIEKSELLSREETLKAIPTLEPEELRGGVTYYDGQFDDSRLAICLAKTAVDHGATLINYMKVTRILKTKGVCSGVHATDLETGKHYRLTSRVVINATGVFSDALIRKDNPKAKPIIAPSQGVHIVLDKSFQPGSTAILVPHTSDNRVLFMVPWLGRILLGTTDTEMPKPTLEPRPLKEEIAFLLTHAGKYLTKQPTKKDILSVFAGLRPLIKAKKGASTASLSRDHTLIVSSSGLITIAGGKWTTYRKMAEDVIDKAMEVGSLPKRSCITETLKLHGWKENIDPRKPMSTYGTDAKDVRALLQEKKQWKQAIHPHLPYTYAEVIWAVREEMARTVEDVLSRRTRALLLDARASLACAPRVAKILALELKKDKKWEKEQIAQYTALVKHYLPSGK